jgi:hypothetical protein
LRGKVKARKNGGIHRQKNLLLGGYLSEAAIAPAQDRREELWRGAGWMDEAIQDQVWGIGIAALEHGKGNYSARGIFPDLGILRGIPDAGGEEQADAPDRWG